VPDFELEPGVTQETSKVAADQLTTLAVQTRRFAVIERAQMEQLLKEQNLSGVVNPAQIAQKGQINGVDYLLIGKVTNMRVMAEQSGSGFNFGRLAARTLGVFDYNNRSSSIKVDCGVDIRLVDATTGVIEAAQNSEYSRTDSISAFGISILGVDASSDANLQIDDDNRGKILRLALDDAVRKMLPSVDNFLVSR
jgi:curli biogenesis system outer membrane secretion channel CsgG